MTLKTNLRLLVRVLRHAPAYTLFFLAEGLLMGFNQAVGTYHIHHIFDLLQQQAGFAPVLHLLLEFAVYLLLHYAFFHWFHDFYQPRARERLHLAVGTRVFQNTDTATDVIRRATAQVDDLLENVARILTHAVAGVAIAVLLFEIDVLMACICLLACAVRLTVVMFHDHLAARHHQALEEFEEQEEVSGAFNLKADALRDFRHRKRALISEGNRRLARITFAAEGSMTALDFGVILLMLYKLSVVGSVTLGGVAVTMAALWILSWQLRSLFDRAHRLCVTEKPNS